MCVNVSVFPFGAESGILSLCALTIVVHFDTTHNFDTSARVKLHLIYQILIIHRAPV